MVTVECAQCGAKIRRRPGNVSPNNFCSRACLGAWRSSRFAGAGNPAWLGGHAEYRGENWERQRRAARDRDDDTCQRCGRQPSLLTVHHIRPFHLFADYREANVLDNLVTLCNVCHGIEEIAFWKANPELVTDRTFPNCVAEATCIHCGGAFVGGSGAAKVCPSCRARTCAHCGRSFSSRRLAHRDVKYCSRACRNAAIARPEQRCEACGAAFVSDRPGVRFCTRQCFLVHANPRRAWAARRSKT